MSHALLSPSASHRWIECPPSVRLTEFMEDKGNHRTQHKIQLRKCLGSEVHQWWRSKVQRKPYHSEVGYQDGREA